jgi:anti-sigma B factor antagonist
MTLRGTVETVKLHGRLDWLGGQQLQAEVDVLVGSGCRIWVIDMSQVEFVDSAGLVALIKGLHAAKANGAKLAICSLRPSVHLVFEISKLDRAFSIFDTHDAAVTYCRPSEAKVINFSLGVA